MPSGVGSKHISKVVGSMWAEKDEDLECLQVWAESKNSFYCLGFRLLCQNPLGSFYFSIFFSVLVFLPCRRSFIRLVSRTLTALTMVCAVVFPPCEVFLTFIRSSNSSLF